MRARPCSMSRASLLIQICRMRISRSGLLLQSRKPTRSLLRKRLKRRLWLQASVYAPQGKKPIAFPSLMMAWSQSLIKSCWWTSAAASTISKVSEVVVGGSDDCGGILWLPVLVIVT